MQERDGWTAGRDRIFTRPPFALHSRWRRSSSQDEGAPPAIEQGAQSRQVLSSWESEPTVRGTSTRTRKQRRGAPASACELVHKGPASRKFEHLVGKRGECWKTDRSRLDYGSSRLRHSANIDTRPRRTQFATKSEGWIKVQSLRIPVPKDHMNQHRRHGKYCRRQRQPYELIVATKPALRMGDACFRKRAAAGDLSCKKTGEISSLSKQTHVDHTQGLPQSQQNSRVGRPRHAIDKLRVLLPHGSRRHHTDSIH